MDQLTLRLNQESLLALMQDFHLLTGIKIALFDTAGNEILSYPHAHCAFCASVRKTADGEAACLNSNIRSFRRCQTTQKLEIFTCHAGLIESTAPLIDNGSVIGYIMFGQITDDPRKTQVLYKTTDQIRAAAKILEACTFYVLLKDMVRLHRTSFIENLNSFLLAHLHEDLSVDRLTEEFHISKNKLYDSCSRYMPIGIAEHIKNLRIDEARRLLKETDLPVNVISDKVGFNDYNYFCRVFKQKTGVSALRYRKGAE